MWQKVLQSLMCFAVCLPTQLLTNCCCTQAAALVRASDPASPAPACCAHKTQPQLASEVAEPPSCCKAKSLSARDAGKPIVAPVEYESQCDCSSDEHTAIIAKLVDVPIVYATLAASWEIATLSLNASVRFIESDRPPIAHNRRQSQLCVWLN